MVNKSKQVKSKLVASAPLKSGGKKALKSAIDAGYDAVDTRRNRKRKTVNLKSEDKVLNPRDRDQLTSDTRNLQRNFSIARFAINSHLDYVSSFSFRCRIQET